MQSSKIRDYRMAGGRRILAVLTAVLCILTTGWTGATGSAEAEASAERQAARDITRECRITPASKKKEFKKAREAMPQSVGFRVAKEIEEATGIETRTSVLGYLQRGGDPAPYDMILATKLGNAAADFLAQGRFGNLVAVKNGGIVATPLSVVAGKVKEITEKDPVLKTARDLGICFGD